MLLLFAAIYTAILGSITSKRLPAESPEDAMKSLMLKMDKVVAEFEKNHPTAFIDMKDQNPNNFSQSDVDQMMRFDVPCPPLKDAKLPSDQSKVIEISQQIEDKGCFKISKRAVIFSCSNGYLIDPFKAVAAICYGTSYGEETHWEYLAMDYTKLVTTTEGPTCTRLLCPKFSRSKHFTFPNHQLVIEGPTTREVEGVVIVKCAVGSELHMPEKSMQESVTQKSTVVATCVMTGMTTTQWNFTKLGVPVKSKKLRCIPKARCKPMMMSVQDDKVIVTKWDSAARVVDTARIPGSRVAFSCSAPYRLSPDAPIYAKCAMAGNEAKWSYVFETGEEKELALTAPTCNEDCWFQEFAKASVVTWILTNDEDLKPSGDYFNQPLKGDLLAKWRRVVRQTTKYWDSIKEQGKENSSSCQILVTNKNISKEAHDFFERNQVKDWRSCDELHKIFYDNDEVLTKYNFEFIGGSMSAADALSAAIKEQRITRSEKVESFIVIYGDAPNTVDKLEGNNGDKLGFIREPKNNYPVRLVKLLLEAQLSDNGAAAVMIQINVTRVGRWQRLAKLARFYDLATKIDVKCPKVGKFGSKFCKSRTAGGNVTLLDDFLACPDWETVAVRGGSELKAIKKKLNKATDRQKMAYYQAQLDDFMQKARLENCKKFYGEQFSDNSYDELRLKTLRDGLYGTDDDDADNTADPITFKPFRIFEFDDRKTMETTLDENLMNLERICK